VKTFRRMRDGRQQPETLIARASEEMYLPHRRNALGKVEHWALPWVEDAKEEYDRTTGADVRECVSEVLTHLHEREEKARKERESVKDFTQAGTSLAGTAA
jgi:hypothetical protein